MKMKKTLRPCPESPNCVSSQSTDPSKWMAPLRFKGQAPTVRAEILTPAESLTSVRSALSALGDDLVEMTVVPVESG